MKDQNPVQAAADDYESRKFKVTFSGVKARAGKAPVGVVEFESVNETGKSKIRLYGEESLATEFRAEELYDVTFNLAQAKPQSYGVEQE